jgi:hypothetical protein
MAAKNSETVPTHDGKGNLTGSLATGGKTVPTVSRTPKAQIKEPDNDTRTLKVPQSIIDYSLGQLQCAIALGQEITAPVGSICFESHIYDGDGADVDFTLGTYGSEKDAKAAIAKWIIWDWGNSGRNPWDPDRLISYGDIENFDDAERKYLASHTNDEIIDWFFNQSSDRYDINRIEVSGSPGQLAKESVLPISSDIGNTQP